MKNFNIVLLCGLILPLFLTSCDSNEKKLKEENDRIEAYIAEHPEYSFVKKSSGLYYADIKVGNGVVPESGDKVFVKYTGTLLDGTLFDTNEDKPTTLDFIIDFGTVVKGFEEGVSYMSVGGEAIIILPSALGYGNTNNIFDPYTPLVFRLKLKKVQRL